LKKIEKFRVKVKFTKIHKWKFFVRIECNGGKYSLGLKDVVFEIKSIVHPGNNEYTWKTNFVWIPVQTIEAVKVRRYV